MSPRKGGVMNHQNMGNCVGERTEINNATTNISCYKREKSLYLLLISLRTVLDGHNTTLQHRPEGH